MKPIVPPASADVLLADGTIAVVRPARRDDRDALLSLHADLSSTSAWLRFFSASPESGPRYVDHLFRDPESVIALVAVVRGELIGLATAELDGDAAEVAFVVADVMHGRGVGTILLEHLAAACRARGVLRFVAEVLTENHPMIQVLTDAGFPGTHNADGPTTTWEFGTTPVPATLDTLDERERYAEGRSLRPLLAPRGVAVVGVADADGAGRAVLRAVVDGSYTGSVFAIHPTAADVDGTAAYQRLADLPERPDLLIIAVPAHQVLATIEEAGAAGVPAAIVLSTGFDDLGAESRELRRAILRTARDHDVRLVGPNSAGVLCNGPATRLNATLSPVVPPPGGLAIASESGGVGLALLDLATRLGVGVRQFVSLGTRPDVSCSELLAAWHDDPDVHVAAIYLDSADATPKLTRIARRFCEHKPLLALVGGRSVGTARPGDVNPIAPPDVAARALFAQTGVISCHSPESLMHVAQVLTEQPVPAGRRLGIVSNAVGVGTLIADAADRAGLDVTNDPISLGANASVAQIASAAADVCGEVDVVTVAVVRTSTSAFDGLVSALGRVRRSHPGVAVALVVIGGERVSPDPAAGVTVFHRPAAVIEALAQVADYADWRRAPRPEGLPEDARRSLEARQHAERLLAGSHSRSLSLVEEQELLGPYGIRPLGEVVIGRYAAAGAAARIGFPVAVKVADAEVLHKTQRGLVRTDLHSPATVLAAVRDFETEMGIQHLNVLVQPMVRGAELALGISRHPTMGPVVTVAAGGVTTELLDDRAVLSLPVTKASAGQALRSLRIWPLLEGFHGSTPVDVDSLENLVVAVGEVARDVPQIVELAMNPVIVDENGAAQVDVKVRLAPDQARVDLAVRQLSDAQDDAPAPGEDAWTALSGPTTRAKPPAAGHR